MPEITDELPDQPEICQQPRTKPLEVLGLGLSRSGTSSLLEALQILGYGTVFSSRELVRRNLTLLGAEALDAKFAGKGRPWQLEQFESVWGDYRAVTGELASSMAEECIREYPDAKVILTVRDDEQVWLQSLLATMWHSHSVWTNKLLKRVDPSVAKLRAFTDCMWKYVYNSSPQTEGIRRYREHNAMVQRLVEPKERLLVFDVKEGWGPLCKFLGKDVPRQPFPHALPRDDHRKLFATLRKRAMGRVFVKLMLWRALPAMLLVIGLRASGSWRWLRQASSRLYSRA